MSNDLQVTKAKDAQVVKTRIWPCGGAGMNIVQNLPTLDVDMMYLDGSQANETEAVREANAFYIPGLKGAGSDRKRAYEKARPYVPKLVKEIGAADFNIVVFSLAGGSGSVIGPMVVSTLMAKGEAVVAVVVGVSDSGTGIKNTSDTLKTLEGIAARATAPVVINYHENQAGVPLKTIDDEMAFAIFTLVHLTNQNNHGLDTQDVYNWVNYNATTPVPPALSALSIYDSRQEAAGVLEPIATLSLYNDRDKANPFGTPYYTKTGYPRTPDAEMPEQTHFVISVKLIDDYFQELNAKQTAMNRSFSNFRNRRAIVDVDDNVNDDGFVL